MTGRVSEMLGLRRSRGAEPSARSSLTEIRCSHPTVVFFMAGFDATDNELISGW